MQDRHTVTDAIKDFLKANPKTVVLTGAGISLASGIPTYRDSTGKWQRNDPIQHRDFVEKPASRQRYWARSYAGWPAVGLAQPNAAHLALAQLEAAGFGSLLVTQNVDRLHQRAGSQKVIDLHGRLDRVVCLRCGEKSERARMQERIVAHNHTLPSPGALAPDGDADVPDDIISEINVPACESCGGVLKPDVVFFGDSVPRTTVEEIFAAIDAAGALLVIGSSLMVYSGFRFCRHAHQAGFPLACINPGATRADDLFTLKSESGCTEQLQALAAELTGG
ncbi:MAG: NAD-dependent deacetylase [OM182 bacterium BACL3 MAG-120619-bin3]|uniref:protein acetyllysine N-acetyltransferase n=3 Tax=OM182 clade TaxID=745002 RepID=A0A0R2S4W8_9GAMM|nr:MAG: NAD-dependent deacetylase [OM182 bacterium BACL3 MAG-120507-bin80]KRO77925.1 MAG: NAD-dependent deacetylase [OM182 bacterium BACL3 MAG-120619-bin3]KRP26087.1 MAG: NAD-dependent deacetylase [OM182 bacterium BACL3 MAG-120924-bin41]